MSQSDDFMQKIAPHFESAYNLARWLTKSDADSADVLQDACVKAFRFLHSSNPENPKSWFFQIVRNTAYTLLKSKKLFVELDPQIQDTGPSVEQVFSDKITAQHLHRALDELPVQYREILILREFEELNYEEISKILEVPIGTVMSRISRARNLLKETLNGESL